MKRLMMTAAALALLPHAAAANLSVEDRTLSPEERAAGRSMVSALITAISSMVYTYDKHCETLPKKLVDDYTMGLIGLDPVITADSMKYMDDEYRRIGKEEFCKVAKGEIEKLVKKSQQ